ncbi:hypothetical protein [Natronobacterium texcoconense]|uniref:Uncharacterized protein n=1 Tax=Natronobacterium texcoconense TaxID=1095778 RepID=A0A1H1CB38_NATTX|nr:hypothetical protein [Natronobacterium texcoconense]SDQ61289.1 hypothetical protein SAMN04489842_1337 [Natronobacterium texcoconense]
MYRRSVISSLAVLSAGALAGCLGGSCTGGTDVRFEPVDAATIADREATNDFEETPAVMADLATRALAGEEPTIEVTHRSPLGWLGYVHWNGAFYEITTKTVAEGQVAGPEYELSRNREMDDEELAGVDALSYAVLPTHDRRRVDEAVDYNAERVETMGFSISTVAGYLEADDQDASVLAAGVDEPYLEIEGSYVELERLGEGTTTAKQLRYGRERVADDVEAFADYVLDRRGAELPELSDDARALLAEAREEDGRVNVCESGYEDEEGDEEAMEARREAVEELRTILSDLEAQDESPDRIDYVRYEDEWYRLSLSGWAV